MAPLIFCFFCIKVKEEETKSCFPALCFVLQDNKPIVWLDLQFSHPANNLTCQVSPTWQVFFVTSARVANCTNDCSESELQIRLNAGDTPLTALPCLAFDYAQAPAQGTAQGAAQGSASVRWLSVVETTEKKAEITGKRAETTEKKAETTFLQGIKGCAPGRIKNRFPALAFVLQDDKP